jgi:protein SCO1/2
MGGPMNAPLGVPSTMPVDLSNVGIDQKLNSQVPLDLTFRDELGRSVKLGNFFHDRPVILNLVYYNCSMLCPEALNGLASSLKLMTLDLGKDYEVLTVSFDPADTPEVSREKQRMVLSEIGKPNADQGWHFLTGDQDSIQRLTQAVGFRYHWDEKTKQFFHATGIMVLTPTGKISKYFYGVDFKPGDLRFGLIQASDNKIGNMVDAVLLFCCRYDARTGKYDWLVARLLSIGGAFTILVLGTFLIVMFKFGDGRHPPGKSA